MKKYTSIITIILLMLSISTSGQNKWKWELGIAGTQNSGNVDNFSLKHNQDLSRNDSLLTVNLNYKFVYQKQEGKEKNKGLNTGFKLDLWQYDKWSPFVALETESNHYKGYKLKLNALAGVKYRFWYKKDTCDYSLSTALTYENVTYTDEETDLKKELCRLSLRPKIKQRICESMYFENKTFYQPRLNDMSDYIINTKSTLSNKISKKVFIDLSFVYEYRSVIPDDVEKRYDITTEVSLKIKL